MFKILYRIGKTEKELSKLEWIREPRKENDEISPFFQEHLKNIFPELELLIFKKNGQETTKYYLKEAKKILDAICWYPKEQFFIIFEYKSKKPPEIMKQVRGYLGTISNGSNDCHDLFDYLNAQFPPKDKKISWKYKDIKWDKTRLIWISPELPEDDWYYGFGDIIWVESKWYKTNSEIAVSLESEDEEELLEKLSKKEAKKAGIKSLSQLFKKMKMIDKKVKEQIEKFHETIEKKFDLIFKFYCYEKPFWYNGLVWYYTKDGKKIFWLTISVDKPPRVYFSPKIDRKTIIIKDENSFSQSLLIIKEILAKQKSKNE